MTDQQDKNIEQLAQENAASGESMQVNDVQDDAAEVVSTGPAAVSAPAQRAAAGSSSALAWLALLLALVVATALGWLVWEERRQDAGFSARLQAVEASVGRDAGDLDAMERRWQDRLATAVSQLQAGSQELGSQSGQLAQALQALQEQVAGQGAELARYSANDRDAWLLAEVQYLLRLANQRLLMAGDAVAAEALLGSADNILRDLDDVRLHEVRAAVAADLAAVRAVPRIDVEGLYLRLSALIEQAGALVIFQLPRQEDRQEQAPAQNWQGRLRQGYEAALASLSRYIIIRRRDAPMQVLMDPQWERLVRQNLRMLLEQAQIALLSGNEMLYRESLERAQHWVGEFAESDETASLAISGEITRLAGMKVATRAPDISRSVQALDALMQQRLQQGGAQ